MRLDEIFLAGIGQQEVQLEYDAVSGSLDVVTAAPPAPSAPAPSAPPIVAQVPVAPYGAIGAPVAPPGPGKFCGF